MLLASRGPALVDLAVEKGVDLAFEGAVGGGIPIIRTLRDAFASDWVQGLTAIINGTCNYCLTRMQGDGLTMEAAIAEAQAKGYAEANPSLDVDGHDAAHKLIVLAMLAFGARVDWAEVSVEGIRAIDEHDHAFARRFGYVIKHLAIGKDHGDDIELRVHPALVPRSHGLANVSGVLNAVLLEGRALGPCLVYGRGAGDLPTAVSVVADILDVARSLVAGVAGLQTRGVVASPRKLRPMADVESRYYLRFDVADRPRVMAGLATALGDQGVSIEQIVQEAVHGRRTGDPPAKPSPGGAATVVMTTQRAREGAVRAALASIAKEPFLAGPPRLLRIVDVRAVGSGQRSGAARRLRLGPRRACHRRARAREACPDESHRLSRRHGARSVRDALGGDGRSLRDRLRAPAHVARREGHRRRVQHRERRRPRTCCASSSICRCSASSARARARASPRRGATPWASSPRRGAVASGAVRTRGPVASVSTRTHVVQQAAPLFVALAEEGWLDGDVPRLVARRYVEPLVTAGARAIVLGCTHFPLLRGPIADAAAELAGAPVPVVDSAQATAREVAAFLAERGLEADRRGGGASLELRDRSAEVVRIRRVAFPGRQRRARRTGRPLMGSR